MSPGPSLRVPVAGLAAAGPALRAPGGTPSGGGRPREQVRPRAARGFTLIEVLLATVLLAAGLALAFSTLRASTAVVERGELLAARSDRMRAAEGFLRRRLSAAVPMAFAIDPGTGDVLRFVGDPDRIRFVADLPDYLGQGGPHLHDIRVVEGRDDAVVAVSFALVLAGETVSPAQPRAPEVLVPGLTSIRIRYRGLDQENRLGPWSDQWDATDELPLMVSVEISTADGGAWPPMVVALPQAGSGAAGSGTRRAMPVLPGNRAGGGQGGGNRRATPPLPGRP